MDLNWKLQSFGGNQKWQWYSVIESNKSNCDLFRIISYSNVTIKKGTINEAIKLRVKHENIYGYFPIDWK